MKTILKTLLVGALLLLWVSCEDKHVVPVQPEDQINAPGVMPDTTPSEEEQLYRQLKGYWLWEGPGNDTVILAFEKKYCFYYYQDTITVSIRYTIWDSKTITYGDNNFLLYNKSEIEFIHNDRLRMYNTQVMGYKVYHSEIQYFTRLKS